MMNNIDEGLVLAHFIVSDDVERSRRFYTEVLGGRVAFSDVIRGVLAQLGTSVPAPDRGAACESPRNRSLR